MTTESTTAEVGAGAAAEPAAPVHPLEPLAAEEIGTASSLLKQHPEVHDECRFVFIELKEPTKSAVQAFDAEGTPVSREAFLLLRDRRQQRTLEAVVDLTQSSVVSLSEVPDVQPPMAEEEFLFCEELIRADPRVQEALVKRGVTDPSHAIVDKWAAGYTMLEDDPSARRISRPLLFICADQDDPNGYAKPVENLIITVDLDKREILAVDDYGVVELPPKKGNYSVETIIDPENSPHFDQVREPMKPIEISQSQGPSFIMDDHGIAWANWKLRIGFTPREGLVLHNITYTDRGTERPVLYRASLSEMYVPYGDPGHTHWNKNVFDEGEYGLGGMANSLVLGCDCLGEITYLDAHVCNQDGEPVTIDNAICIHEEDAGIGWKHTDYRTGEAEVRRNRRLVISIFTTVGNYDYGFYWYLYLDGSIEFEAKLTGILSTGAFDGERPQYGTVLAPGLYGPNHQHFFGMRLDMNVDGPNNSVYEVQAEVAPSAENVWGNAWYESKTLLRTEAEGQRVADPLRGRSWIIANAEKVNPATGNNVGYKLELGGSMALPLAQPGSQQYNRGGFTRKHLWVTAFKERERYAAGEYVPQNPGGDGLPRYAAADRPLEGADLVVWPILCAHHAPRPEDWPVMPVARVGFHLKPAGFFDGNPMLDYPAETPAAGCCGGVCHCH
ncbi:primary-amine oxidase [Nesterenkonia muleiensis]|uniref:primary-amine oxidase n=1 Tax=Nesterenkonia muleiensis TaxID=2282648 RepID=UPI000E74AD31|nr:primary-amine oxidase [Nesterenkonia muleiensis]